MKTDDDRKAECEKLTIDFLKGLAEHDELINSRPLSEYGPQELQDLIDILLGNYERKTDKVSIPGSITLNYENEEEALEGLAQFGYKGKEAKELIDGAIKFRESGMPLFIKIKKK